MLNFLKNTYNGKTVFLTGHTGFKGSWLLILLEKLGAKVVGFSLAPESPKDLYHLINGDAKCQSIIGDIQNKAQIQKAIIDAQPDFIFHLAAQALVIPSYEDPLKTFNTNIMGTAHVLDAVRFLNKKCVVVNITTDKVYENKERLAPYKENEPLGGYDPYSASKAGAEIVNQSYRSSFFNPQKYESHLKSVSTARSGNVIGGGDWNEARLIPDLARALEANEVLQIRNPHAVRPWQHVLDPLAGYLLLGAKMNIDPVTFASNYNFGPEPEGELTVKELIEIAIKTWGQGNFKVHQTSQQVHEAGLLKLDIEKAKKELGWKPLLPAANTIEWTIDWYKTEKEERAQKTLNQVDDYLSMLS